MLHSFLMQFLRYYNILPLTAALSKPVRLGYKDLYTNGLLKLLINNHYFHSEGGDGFQDFGSGSPKKLPLVLSRASSMLLLLYIRIHIFIKYSVT